MTIGTIVGVLPGIGTTLAAALGYTTGREMYNGTPAFGEGAPEGIAATEATNLIPALSLGIPGNVAAVFIILAADTIGGFNPGPAVFRFTQDTVNPELVIAYILARPLESTIRNAFEATGSDPWFLFHGFITPINSAQIATGFVDAMGSRPIWICSPAKAPALKQ